RMGKNFADAIGKGKEVFGEAPDNSGAKLEGKRDQGEGRAAKRAEEVGDKSRKHAEATADKAEQTLDKDGSTGPTGAVPSFRTVQGEPMADIKTEGKVPSAREAGRTDQSPGESGHTRVADGVVAKI